MNDDERLEDLKQFIAATVGQTEAHLDQKITSLDKKIESLRNEMNDGFAGVSDRRVIK